jgi:hypothetical protein
MTIMTWICTGVVGGSLCRCEEAEEYEIFERTEVPVHETEGVAPENLYANGQAGFFVRRLVADCDDIGPLATFKDAEDILLKFLGMLVAFEEEAWRVVAADTMRLQLLDAAPQDEFNLVYDTTSEPVAESGEQV